jgi:predicted RNA-binding Zn-ribbon protein involved in translation (DUF1610 family)
MNDVAAVMNDQGLAEICRLLEREDMLISPDAVWLSSRPGFYGHLLALDAFAVSRERALDILCPECGMESMRPQPYPAPGSQPYRGYCPVCGWIGLSNQQAHYWQVQPQKLAKWLSAGLGLAPRYAVEPLVDNVLWRLGELEHRRRRHTVFFARRLSAMPEQVAAKLTQLVAPGAEVIITADEPASLHGTALGDRLLVPLRAIAHIRKSGLVIENLDAYLTRPAPVQESAETSLRQMHTQRVALIDGQAIDLSPQVYLFLKILEDADGDEVHKLHIAEGLGLEPGASFRTADIFKRHKQVYAIFVDKDDRGH